MVKLLFLRVITFWDLLVQCARRQGFLGSLAPPGSFQMAPFYRHLAARYFGLATLLRGTNVDLT